MGWYLIFSLMMASVLNITMAACPRQNSKLLDDIISPANAERALQILRLAAVGAKVNPGSGFGILEEVIGSRYLPSAVIPAKPVVPEVRRLPYPRQVVNQPVLEVAPVYQQEVYPQVYTPTVVQEKVYPAMPIPQPYAVATPVKPEVYPSAPVPMVNPFLPAASPVSAIAPPTSSLLPPVDPTQVRSHFLRKIPIPPPSL